MKSEIIGDNWISAVDILFHVRFDQSYSGFDSYFACRAARRQHIIVTRLRKIFQKTKKNDKQFSQNIEVSANLAGASAKGLNESSQHVFSSL